MHFLNEINFNLLFFYDSGNIIFRFWPFSFCCFLNVWCVCLTVNERDFHLWFNKVEIKTDSMTWKKRSPGVNELKHVKTSSYGSRTATSRRTDGLFLGQPGGGTKRRWNAAVNTQHTLQYVMHVINSLNYCQYAASTLKKKTHTTSLSDCRESSCLLHSRWESTGNESLTCLCLFKATNLILWIKTSGTNHSGF